MAGSLNRAGKRYAGRSKSSIISHLLDEDADNCRRQMEQRGITPKNHHRDNLKNIAKIQKLAKQQEEEKAKRAKRAGRKNPKYSKVDSKLKLSLMATAQSATSSTAKQSTNFIAKNVSRIHSTSTGCKKDKTSTNRKPAIPTRSALRQKKLNGQQMPRDHGKDFVAMNKLNGQRMYRKPEEKADAKFVDKADYGKVPEYMVQRKIEKEAMAQRMREEAERRKIPPGMRKMADEERLDTLRILECNKKEVLQSIKNLPLVIETPSMIRYQGELNEKMKEIEHTISIFSKPTVFVAMEEE